MESGNDQKDNKRIQKGDKRRQDILLTALHILTREGYGELTMRRIAKDTGMSLGNLQYHFPNKKALLQRLLDEYLDQAMKNIRERSHYKESSAEKQFDTAVNVTFTGQASKEACQVFYELWALSTRDREAADALKSFYEEYCSIVAGYLRHMNPSLAEETLRRRAALFVAMMEGLSLFHLWEDSTFPNMSQLEEEFKRVIMTAMIT